MDALGEARVAPCDAQRRIHPLAGRICRGRYMMKETAECEFAETFIFASVQDELVPEIINYSRWHPDQPIAHT
jgi:hypothetical protein